MQYLTQTTCSSVEKTACASDLIVTYSLKIFNRTCSKKMNSQCKCDLAAHDNKTLACLTVNTLFGAVKVRWSKTHAAFI